MDLAILLNDPVTQRLLVAAGLGALIGLERELAGKDPSLRTFSLICLGSCIFTEISRHSIQYNPNADPARIAAQVVAGISFLGAGAIFRSHRGVSGLTTAALMWVTAGIGMSVGFELESMAVTATLIALLISLSLKLVHTFLGWIGLKNRDKATE